MNRTVSRAYCFTVIISLLGVIAYLGWDGYAIWKMNMLKFKQVTGNYTMEYDNLLIKSRDVQAETDWAENIMKMNKRIIAVQVIADNRELRFSSVMPLANGFRETPIEVSNEQSGILDKIHLGVLEYPVNSMPGYKIIYMGLLLTWTEIHQSLIMLLVVIGGFFVLTCLLILFSPGKVKKVYPSVSGEKLGTHSDETESSANRIFDNIQEKIADDIPDFEFGDNQNNSLEFKTVDLDEKKLPIKSDGNNVSPQRIPVTTAREHLLDALYKELKNSEYMGTEVSLAIIDFSQDGEGAMRYLGPEGHYFTLPNNRFGIIGIGKDFESMMSHMKDFVRKIESRYNIKVGISSKNDRKVEPDELLFEAESALLKTGQIKNIAGFQSDPKKYRDFKNNELLA